MPWVELLFVYLFVRASIVVEAPFVFVLRMLLVARQPRHLAVELDCLFVAETECFVSIQFTGV